MFKKVTQECQSCIIQKLAMSQKVTQGVLLWSAPLTLLLNGQTMAVLLMDTQVLAFAKPSVKQDQTIKGGQYLWLLMKG